VLVSGADSRGLFKSGEKINKEVWFLNKKLFVVIIFFCVITSIFVGKMEKDMNYENRLRVHDYAMSYLTNRNYNINSFSLIEDEDVVLFSSEDKFGIGSFYINEENNITNSISIVDITNNHVAYTQIVGKNRCFITIFFNDEKLKAEATKIHVTYKGDLPQSILKFEEAKTYGNAEMTSYKGKLRTIDLIQYFDRSNMELGRSQQSI
jgi:hypothetical protein